MFCHLIVKIMKAIQPIRGQESLYKLYNECYTPYSQGLASLFVISVIDFTNFLMHR